MKTNLTDKLMKSLVGKRRDAPMEIWDKTLSGLVVRVGRSGTVSAGIMSRPRGRSKPVRVPIGTFPPWSLAELRDSARELLRDMQAGIDPREVRAARLRIEAAASSSTFENVAERFVSQHVVKARTARSIELRIRRELIPRWKDWQIDVITRSDVRRLLEEIVARGHPEAARQTFLYTSRLFRWAVGHDLLQHSPCDGISMLEMLGERRARARVLNDSELRIIWAATSDSLFGQFIQILLLTGVRRSELGFAPWSEINLETAIWTIPPGRMKSVYEHVVPLSAPVLTILRELPRSVSPRLFPAFGYSILKRRLDARITSLNGGVPLAPWRLHDARRTFRTGLSTLQIAPHIAELCIAHRQRGIVGVYDLHRFDQEKKFAFDAWAARLMDIVHPSEDKVVRLHR
jgi:integrase